MKIKIQTSDTNLNLVLPTNLLVGKTVVKIAGMVGRKYAGDALKDIPPEALELLCAELRRVKKKHGSWELVDIRTAGGSIVHITL